MLLTIAIPTYNRSESLGKLLFQLDAAKINSLPDVVVRIHDNSSRDHQQSNESKAYRYNCIYHWNEQNIGFAGNLISLLERSESQYLLYLSDDDNINQDSLNELILALRKNVTTSLWILPFTCDSIPKIYNTKTEWQSASTLAELFSVKTPFILFSSFVLPLALFSSDKQAFIHKLSEFKSNAYIQILIVVMIQSLLTAIPIEYFDRPTINYIHARRIRFKLENLYESLHDIYLFMLEHHMISSKRYIQLSKSLVRSHLLMALQHKGRLKIIQDAPKFYLNLISMGFKSLDIKNICLSLALFLLPSSLVRIVLLSRGNSCID